MKKWQIKSQEGTSWSPRHICMSVFLEQFTFFGPVAAAREGSGTLAREVPSHSTPSSTLLPFHVSLVAHSCEIKKKKLFCKEPGENNLPWPEW